MEHSTANANPAQAPESNDNAEPEGALELALKDAETESMSQTITPMLRAMLALC